jgi:23S rRNA (cytidine1920-2'-O)/16S rRNA (cytidine1409-2'-O)-methyltransferase
MVSSRRRLDAEMVAQGLAGDAGEAAKAIEDRLVVVDGAPGLKPSTLVDRGIPIKVDKARRFVSRGGDKLNGALKDFGIDVTGKRCLDAGAGSGGFSDCLLKAGAGEVVAVDVGYGQFDWSLRIDPRVRLLERTNVRHLLVPGLEGSFELIVADLSFVTLRSLIPTFARLAAPDATQVLLVKPQFEVSPEDVGPAGIVTDPAVWRLAIETVAQVLSEVGFGVVAVAPSHLRGAEGNQEFFIEARPGATTLAGAISAAVASVS